MASSIASGIKTGVKVGGKYASRIGKKIYSEQDLIMDAGQDIYAGTSRATSASGSGKARKIATEAVGIGANIAVGLAASAAGGPFALILAAGVILGAALDGLWNPFKGYVNDELVDFKKEYDDIVRQMFINEGYNWPLEIKPTVIPITDQDWEELYQHMDEYYKNNGIISPEAAFDEVQFIQYLSSFTRISKRLFENEDGTISKEAVYRIMPYSEDNDIEDIELLIILLRKVREKRRKSNIEKLSKKIVKPNRFLEFSKRNWQLYIIVLICIMIIIFSCSILITLVKSKDE